MKSERAGRLSWSGGGAHLGEPGGSALPEEVCVGAVDKFQGQQASQVIYSTATSSAEEAPRGMTFLYNPNRLNVATSRARCSCILVASPRVLEPDCRTPDQMRRANGLCRFRELARVVELGRVLSGHGP